MGEKAKFISRPIRAPKAVSRRQLQRVQIGVSKVVKPKLLGGTKLVDEPVYGVREVEVPVKDGEECVDLDALGLAVDAACAELDAEGYDIVAITPIISGRHKSEVQARESPYNWTQNRAAHAWAWAYGYGYSVTEGVSITGKLRQ
jgi:hypothetical protein